MTFTEFLAVHLRRLAAIVIGPTADAPLAGWFTWGDAAEVMTSLALATVCHLALAGYVRRQRKSSTQSQGSTSMTHQHVVLAVARPLAVLIWVYALYLAATPLLGRLDPRSGVAEIRQAMDDALNLAAYAMLCWFTYRATFVVESRLRRWTAATAGHKDDLLVSLLGSGLRIAVVATAIIVGLTLLPLPARFETVVGRLTSTVLIVAMALMLWRTVATGQRLLLGKFDISLADNLRARQVATQLHIISRVVYLSICLFAIAAILMLFPTVRHVGTSLLASAGIAGVILGFAAQKILGNLIAGVQIALTQTIRQDDVVVVEGEWGRVEEITLSYVIVHVWDDRRLVLPLSYFIEKPFENWTRTTAALTGTVLLWVDYAIDVEEARAALRDIIERSALWDRRFWNLQVSDVSERTVQLRVLASAADSGRSWDLRCEIREKFIAYLQGRHPASLPRSRTEILGLEAMAPALRRAPTDGVGEGLQRTA